MSTFLPRLQRILPLLSSAIGILARSSGIYGIICQQAFSDILGIPVTTSSALAFVSFAAVRNVSSGLTVLALLYTGNTQAVATLLICGLATSLTDAWICFQHNRIEGKGVGHAVMGTFVGLLGLGMYWG
jgi:hypothetical protein